MTGQSSYFLDILLNKACFQSILCYENENTMTKLEKIFVNAKLEM